MDLKVRFTQQQNSLAPTYETPDSAGMDLRAALETTIQLAPEKRVLIPTGLCLEIPPGYEGQVRPRSGLALKQGLTVLNAPGTIDADYRGEIKIILINHGSKKFVIERGMRIAQLIISKVEKIKWNQKKKISILTKRSNKGFGSTGL